MSKDNVSLLPTAYPELQMPDKAGIRIHAIPYQREDGVRSIRVVGICQCAEEESLNMPKTILQDVTIVLVYGSEHMPISFQAIGDAIVFDDDIRRIGNLLRGYFEIDVFEQSGLQSVIGTYFVSAAFSTYLSNVVKVVL